jgi:hypothetical protein
VVLDRGNVLNLSLPFLPHSRLVCPHVSMLCKPQRDPAFCLIQGAILKVGRITANNIRSLQKLAVLVSVSRSLLACYNKVTVKSTQCNISLTYSRMMVWTIIRILDWPKSFYGFLIATSSTPGEAQLRLPIVSSTTL